MEIGILTLIALLLVCASAVVSVTKQFHMLQQNSYYLSRYFGWLKTSGGLLPMLADAVIKGLLLALAAPETVTLVYCAASFAINLLYNLRAQKKAIKPLIFTARVKRLYVTASLLCIAVTAVGGFVRGCFIPAAAVLALLSFSPAVCAAALGINEPGEAIIRGYYIRDAKRILRSMPDIRVFGITGSYGKTSTKYILNRILSEKYSVCMTPGSFNTPLGVVRTVRSDLTADCRVFLCEMGAKNCGDIKEICDIAAPDAGIITSIGPQHLNTFGSIEKVAETKFELADAVKKKKGMLFLNFDSAPVREKAYGYDHVSYSIDCPSDVRAEQITCGRDGSTFDICFKDRKISISTKLLGRHNVLNVVGAAAAASYMGVSDSDIRFAISRLTPVEHRLELKPFVNGALLIDDAYNSNPEGCLEAVSVLGSFAGMKKIVVTPGLVELGDKEYEANYNLGCAMAKVCDGIYLVGQKRSIPFVDALKASGYDMSKTFVVSTFKDAMNRLSSECDRDTVVLFENDLPDNYAG